ncbi:tRNA threonylcarbamoyladenosine biosynthesis protein TsaE [Rhodococcus sp. Leaf7]|uniref:tRNA (adenosine(37)-N6)-threonylcarbamoyltransferase complex ATPase subunit type 1 TsaE n=1 Tax=unclassified Rhodococcus (in: high G+C Gram-positive bacteria) TaxID=192944 RepID=UPI0005AC92FB|nr:MULTISPECIES: tRNA (adenosine(37)-N6)-threonylcarbamoyltransferase complex ATPase subunit type 1 TsaE [unclassified Rhodococcus (in: high G+C Gram-positive bacteria)]KIQ17132.1 ATP-binding protein [Rhodococcus sp. MEB064]KQU06420.1 tRNA threonylcarbamoyladenosine biosynthesis protein TsaE [Rhodococcus sp. Leaf7]KQU41938.1 tRNA threonylcarbamoyladenosine biosynthesis protein TsaE [Rhodococcus sp. Leaf247]
MADTVLETAEDTERLGEALAHELVAGDVVVLDGPLGAGKTTLTKGLARGLGVVGRVSSPTFMIARTHRPGHDTGPGLVHVDAYRLGLGTGASAMDELDALDLDTELTDSVVVVEWGEGIAETLTDRHLLVRLRREPESDVRTASWEWVRAPSV